MATPLQAARAASASATRSRKRPALTPAAAPMPDTAMPIADQQGSPVPPGLRSRWIAEAAYYIAEKRGFRDGSPEDDWSQAEAQIDRFLAAPPA